MRVLVTRPQAEAEATAKALAARGFEAVIDPMLRIRFRGDAIDATGVDALVISSGNAIAAIEGRAEKASLLPLPLIAVGRRTAAAARAAGFGTVAAADGDLDHLVDFIVAHYPTPTRFLHLAGEDRVADLQTMLAPHGHEVAIAIVYEAHKADRFAAFTQALLRDDAIDAVLHYSARTAEAFIACAAGVVSLGTARLRHVCLSDRVAEPLRAAGVTKISVAASRDEAALIDLIAP
jgi:uroporphyrinogen-III synthase